MPQTPADRAYPACPPGRPSPWRGGWVLAVAGVLAMTGWAGSAALATVVPHRAALDGVLVSRVDHVGVVLPPGATLGDVLVHEGEAVRRGQPVARLDEAALAARLTSAELDLYALRTERACLLDLPLPDRPEPLATQPDTPARLAAARAACETLRREAALPATGAHRIMALLADRQVLLSRLQRLVASPPTGPDDRRGVLDLALRINRLDLDIARFEATLSEFVVAGRHARDARVEALSADIARTTEFIAVLEAHLADPILRAPRDGTIGRLRPPTGAAPTGRSPMPVEVMDVLVDRGAEVRFRAPASTAATLRPGDRLSLRTADGPVRGAGVRATATIASVSAPLSDGRVLVRASLEDETVAALAHPETGVLPDDHAASLVVTIDLDPQPLGRALGWSFGGRADAVPPGGAPRPPAGTNPPPRPNPHP